MNRSFIVFAGVTSVFALVLSTQISISAKINAPAKIGKAAKHYDRATNAHFRPDKPRGATGKSLIVLNPWLSLNQRVPGSSPGAPTNKFRHFKAF
jgi:hypothetical protein